MLTFHFSTCAAKKDRVRLQGVKAQGKLWAWLELSGRLQVGGWPQEDMKGQGICLQDPPEVSPSIRVTPLPGYQARLRAADLLNISTYCP